MRELARQAKTVAGGRFRWGHWGAVVAYAGLIFYLSAQPQPPEAVDTVLQVLGDGVLHAVEYGVLSVLCYRAFGYAAGPWAATRAVILAIVASIGYAITDEIHQAFVPQRDADPIDVLMDAIGALIAALLWGRLVEPVKPEG
jgi:VanZ family protein